MNFFKKTLGVCTLVACCHQFAYGQQQTASDTTKSYCDPKIYGQARPKGVELRYETHFNQDIKSESDNPNFGNGSARINTNQRFTLKIKAPLYLKPHLKLAVGFNYFNEEFNFNNAENLNYPLYKSLEDKHLSRIGGTFYVMKPFRGDNYLNVRTSFDLSGDYDSESDFNFEDYARLSVTAVYYTKTSIDHSYGWGLSYSYSLGRPLIYPVFAYNKNFNNNWGVEMLLPGWFKFRYNNLAQTNYWYTGMQVDGASYTVNLKNATDNQLDRFLFRKAEIKAYLRYEREVYDFVWVGAEVGINKNVSFNVSESESNLLDNNEVIRSNVGFVPYFNVKLFLVPPKKFYKK